MTENTNIITLEDLLQLAKQNGINVTFFDFPRDALVLHLEGKYYIALKHSLTKPRLKQALAHELGHCFTRGFYSFCTPIETRKQIEASADHWAYKKLLPPKLVQELAEKGILS